MKQILNKRRQLAINLRYCYSARRATQDMPVSRSLPTIAMGHAVGIYETHKNIQANLNGSLRMSSCSLDS